MRATRVRDDGLVLGRVAYLSEDAATPVPQTLAACRRLLERIVAEHGEQLFARPLQFDSSAWVSARLAEVLPLPAATKQALLELDGLPRLQAVQRLIAGELRE